MSSWRDHIFREFTAPAARLTLVADPDGLLLDEDLLQGIREKGFELIAFEDPVAFRYAYESRFRSRWDRGEEARLVVMLRSPSSRFETLPYDLLQLGRKLSFSLKDLFPDLSYPVVAALDRADLDSLWEAQEKHKPGALGENATKDFVLRHVFGIAPELIKGPEDLLRMLLRRHYLRQRIPGVLDQRLIQLLRQNPLFQEWPLELIIRDPQAFFQFLQERWPLFLDWLSQPEKFDRVRGSGGGYGLALSGPALLPFDHEDVRIYIDNLFLDGLLRPVSHAHAGRLVKSKPWIATGIRISPEENWRRRVAGLLEAIEKEEVLTETQVRYTAWLRFAYRWAELVALAMKRDASLSEAYRGRIQALQGRVDDAFLNWVEKRYASLISLPSVPPVMLHHVPRYLARSLADDPQKKIAFLMVDGLALDQWIALREELVELDSELRFRESAVFAWIPTITSVSRQAAFAGKPPVYFPTSIHATDRERALWTRFWLEQGLAQHEVAYVKGFGDGDLDEVSELLSQSGLRVVGLVIDKVDRIMHGMQMGMAGMHNQIRQWARHGFMRDLFRLLHQRGFRIYVASDHGNVEAGGVGQPAEGAVADVRGQRVRVYSDARLRAQTKARFPGALEWPPVGLPEDYLPLLAPKRSAFVRAGETVVTHGGISIEELLVPFVQVDRRDR